jgi:hypothetical protein
MITGPFFYIFHSLPARQPDLPDNVQFYGDKGLSMKGLQRRLIYTTNRYTNS